MVGSLLTEFGAGVAHGALLSGWIKLALGILFGRSLSSPVIQKAGYPLNSALKPDLGGSDKYSSKAR